MFAMHLSNFQSISPSLFLSLTSFPIPFIVIVPPQSQFHMHAIYRNLIRLRLWKLYLQTDIDRASKKSSLVKNVNDAKQIKYATTKKSMSLRLNMVKYAAEWNEYKIGVDVNEIVSH